ncbi:MAG: 30S ribosomal protein S13 [Nanoarchaeota archaeon]|nr:30S ribosomal protein S13 [Nanoarchaeota archaeon]MBU4086005.1 30S ribosomal protein S13 [Nanoarchaeota archaeon]
MSEQEARKHEQKLEKESKDKKHAPRIENEERLIRILATDIPGSKKIFVGLVRIKGVSWSFANAICTVLGIDKNRKILSLSKEEIEKIADFIKNPKLPSFLLNRRNDFETGNTLHLTGSDLDLQKEFDIKRLKKIRSYRGWRHATGQPTRGQRTKSHFRARGKKKAVGVKSKSPRGK